MSLVRALLLATVVALSACSSSSGPQPAELPSIYRPLQVRTLWSTNVGSGHRFTFSPVYAGDAVYAAAKGAGAKIVREIRDEDYGGRGFGCLDPEGFLWYIGTYDPWEG